MISNIIFDLDGTLINSEKDILICLNKVLLSYNLKLNSIKPFMHLPLDDIIKTNLPFLNNNEINNIIEEFKKIYDNCSYKHTYLYKNVKNVLNYLFKNNYSLFLATNKRLKPVLNLLNKFNLKNFKDIITVDSIEKKLKKEEMLNYLINKWNLIHKETAFIGDTASDINAAKANNIISIGVLYGYGVKEDIINSRPDYLIMDLIDLKKIINN